MNVSDLRLKLKSKRLESGRFQVNFSTHGLDQEYYGYVLTDPQTPVREVVEKIGRHVDAMKVSERYFQRNLFSIQKRKLSAGSIMIFKQADYASHQ